MIGALLRPADPMGVGVRYPADRPGRGHVESWFLRANDAERRRAVWLKLTIYERVGGDGPVAEIWCITFDGERGKSWGKRAVGPLSETLTSWDPPEAVVGGCSIRIDAAEGQSRGALEDERGAVSWDITWRRADGPIGEPITVYPPWAFSHPAVPKLKAVTPLPVLRLQGTMAWDGADVDVTGWVGSLGHNWGAQYQPVHIWSQCVFPDAHGEPLCFVEGGSGRIRLGRRLSPLLSVLVVRRGDRTWRFGALAAWRNHADVGDMRWTLHTRGPDGAATVSVRADPTEAACLGYRQPSGRMSYCYNSKLASAVLRVNPVNEDGFECRTDHGCALEYLTERPDPRFPHVI